MNKIYCDKCKKVAKGIAVNEFTKDIPALLEGDVIGTLTISYVQPGVEHICENCIWEMVRKVMPVGKETKTTKKKGK